jgi:hypothetical protein
MNDEYGMMKRLDGDSEGGCSVAPSGLGFNRVKFRGLPALSLPTSFFCLGMTMLSVVRLRRISYANYTYYRLELGCI